MALELRPKSRFRHRLGAVSTLAAQEVFDPAETTADCYSELLLSVTDIEAALSRIEERLEAARPPSTAISLEDRGRGQQTARRLLQAPSRLIHSAANAAGRVALNAAGSAAGRAGNFAVSAGQASVATTFRATAFGVRQSVQTTWCVVRPPLAQAVSYVVTPSGFFTSASTLCALFSLPLAALAALASAGAVGAGAASAALQTSAELVRTGACRGPDGAATALEVLQRALRDPNYARELEDMLRTERENSKTRRQKLLRRAHTWATMVNIGIIARVSPRVSDVVSRKVLSSGQPPGLEALRTLGGLLRNGTALLTGGPGAFGALEEVLAGQRSALVESTRLTLAVSTWLNTAGHNKVDLLRSSSGRSVECIAISARHVAEYRSLGLRGGCHAACRDALGVMSSSLAEGPAAAAVSSVSGLVYSPVSLATRWLPSPWNVCIRYN
eukprot:s2494_g3.t1